MKTSRRNALRVLAAGLIPSLYTAESQADGLRLRSAVFDYIRKCARSDGGFAPSPDPSYAGSSDTGESDLAAVTYAAVLAKTFGMKLPNPSASTTFIQRHQRRDGVYVNAAGEFHPDDDLAVLYNTTQAVVALRALGARPAVSPLPVMHRFFDSGRFQRLPWYTTSFFPLFYAALKVPSPKLYIMAIRDHLARNQAEDGYVGDHVAATFHLVHFFRLIGEPVPRARRIVARVLHDQRPDGGWNIKAPDWDVHACFDAVFILRQLGGGSAASRNAIQKGAGWAMRCRTDDGGFAHYPGQHSDMDAVYFQFGTLIQAGLIPGVHSGSDAGTLGWGHAMTPSAIYRHI